MILYASSCWIATGPRAADITFDEALIALVTIARVGVARWLMISPDVLKTNRRRWRLVTP